MHIRRRCQRMLTVKSISIQRLSKNPEDYTDKKSQPHVQVALRMKQKGQAAKAGEVIPYVFCLGADGKSAKSAQADHAFHPDEFRRKDSELKIGSCDKTRRTHSVPTATDLSRLCHQTSISICLSRYCLPSSVCAKKSKAPTVHDWRNV